MRVMPKIKQLESVYFGKAVHVRNDLSNLNEYEPGSGCQIFPKTGIASLEHINQEYPTVQQISENLPLKSNMKMEIRSAISSLIVIKYLLVLLTIRNYLMYAMHMMQKP